eukprot:GHVP01055437.1.p1 GENE.GHVP01055437.1~~GHVP01055437.1.p1  ORF type:complete len:1109 (-),score=211.23 GHVP01055437.1:655-3981(-)
MGMMNEDQKREFMESVSEVHINSFNSMFTSNLIEELVSNLDKRKITDEKGSTLEVWAENVHFFMPCIDKKKNSSLNQKLKPSHCREQKGTYGSYVDLTLSIRVNDGPIITHIIDIGRFPVMVKSIMCNLKGISAKENVKNKEEAVDTGGYFIAKGLEKIIRPLIVQKENTPIGLERKSFMKRGNNYTKLSVSIRCLRDDLTSKTNYIHHSKTGDVFLRFFYNGRSCNLPVVPLMKFLCDASDKEIFSEMIRAEKSDTEIIMAAQKVISKYKELKTQQDVIDILEPHCKIAYIEPTRIFTTKIGYLLPRYILPHLKTNKDKFHFLGVLVHKAFLLTFKRIKPEDPDNPMNHSLFLPSMYYLSYLYKLLDGFLAVSIRNVQKIMEKDKKSILDYGNKIKQLFPVSKDVGIHLVKFFSTGRLADPGRSDVPQLNGITIIPERLNILRFIDHMRSLHRGSYFVELKITHFRRLFPETWGFTCPIDTPDGTQSGVVTHLTRGVKIPTEVQIDENKIQNWLLKKGMLSSDSSLFGNNFIDVILNGKVIGLIPTKGTQELLNEIHNEKATGDSLPYHLETVSFVKKDLPKTYYPGVFMWTTAGRFLRPVTHIPSNKQEYVGITEQVFLDIARESKNLPTPETIHVEEDITKILSLVASLTPFSNFNQSPRSLYQCQMGKQSVGVPALSYQFRIEKKAYYLIYPQGPVVRTKTYDKLPMENNPNGFNAVVAVIANSGYDMEDAFVFNKSSIERGMSDSYIFATHYHPSLDLNPLANAPTHYFGTKTPRTRSRIDKDGLPTVGKVMKAGDPLLCHCSDEPDKEVLVKAKEIEVASIDSVKIIGRERAEAKGVEHALVRYRIQRRPIVGDKYSSRHGQKGVCGLIEETINLPFSESGLVPDIMMNPHAFPSRMTVGMFLEMIGTKAGLMKGEFHDASSFGIDYEPVSKFGELLEESGFNYYGTETLYNGKSGEMMEADIFIGPIHYQRLRHMISDKYQIRTSGPIHALTHQPLGGRKKSGGLRFGEMEKDALLAHGTAFLLKDRMMNCSDYSQTYICKKCNSIFSPLARSSYNTGPVNVICLQCKSNEFIEIVDIPYVFRVVAAELMGLNIKLSFESG